MTDETETVKRALSIRAQLLEKLGRHDEARAVRARVPKPASTGSSERAPAAMQPGVSDRDAGAPGGRSSYRTFSAPISRGDDPAPENRWKPNTGDMSVKALGAGEKWADDVVVYVLSGALAAGDPVREQLRTTYQAREIGQFQRVSAHVYVLAAAGTNLTLDAAWGEDLFNTYARLLRDFSPDAD